jgi:MerR family transcriptional regulator, glutamine synthetase repressor
MLSSSLPVYSLSHVEMRTGFSARQIRYLEQKGLLSPARTPRTGRRVYSETDIDRLLRIKDHLSSGYARERLPVVLAMEDEERARVASPEP